MGDALTFGATKQIRQWDPAGIGWDAGINYGSGAYISGQVTGVVHGAAIGYGAGAGAGVGWGTRAAKAYVVAGDWVGAVQSGESIARGCFTVADLAGFVPQAGYVAGRLKKWLLWEETHIWKELLEWRHPTGAPMKGATLYRVSDPVGGSPDIGRWWTTVDPTAVGDWDLYHAAAGLPPTNTMTSITEAILKRPAAGPSVDPWYVRYYPSAKPIAGVTPSGVLMVPEVEVTFPYLDLDILGTRPSGRPRRLA